MIEIQGEQRDLLVSELTKRGFTVKSRADITKALIVYAHPAHQRSRANRALLNRISDLHNVTVHDLYETYPDFFIDVEAEQKLLLEHDAIVIQHPEICTTCQRFCVNGRILYWNTVTPTGASSSVWQANIWVVLTASVPEHTYSDTGVNERPLSEYFLHYPRMANVCHLEMKPTFEVYHGRHSPDEDPDKTVEQYRPSAEVPEGAPGRCMKLASYAGVCSAAAVIAVPIAARLGLALFSAISVRAL